MEYSATANSSLSAMYNAGTVGERIEHSVSQELLGSRLAEAIVRAGMCVTLVVKSGRASRAELHNATWYRRPRINRARPPYRPVARRTATLTVGEALPGPFIGSGMSGEEQHRGSGGHNE